MYGSKKAFDFYFLFQALLMNNMACHDPRNVPFNALFQTSFSFIFLKRMSFYPRLCWVVPGKEK